MRDYRLFIKLNYPIFMILFLTSATSTLSDSIFMDISVSSHKREAFEYEEIRDAFSLMNYCDKET